MWVCLVGREQAGRKGECVFCCACVISQRVTYTSGSLSRFMPRDTMRFCTTCAVCGNPSSLLSAQTGRGGREFDGTRRDGKSTRGKISRQVTYLCSSSGSLAFNSQLMTSCRRHVLQMSRCRGLQTSHLSSITSYLKHTRMALLRCLKKEKKKEDGTFYRRAVVREQSGGGGLVNSDAWR